jgi:putative ABC transport system permease protein
MLSILAGLTGAMGERASILVAGTVDRHFRGVYDILVRPPGGALLEERTRGLVEANFLGIAVEEGISIQEWREVERLPGVELAAPIAAVG